MVGLCIDVVKNKQNHTVAYTLEIENTIKAFSPDVLRELIENKHIRVINLDVKNGRLHLLNKEQADNKRRRELKAEVYDLSTLINKAEIIANRIDSIACTNHDYNIDTHKWCFRDKDYKTKFTMYISQGRLKARKLNDDKEIDMHTDYTMKTICYLTDTKL